MRHHGDTCCLGQMHHEVFYFRQTAVAVGLRFEYIAPPQTNDGKAVGLVFASSVDVQRQLGLHAGKGGLAAHHLLCQFSNLIPDVCQLWRSVHAKQFA